MMFYRKFLEIVLCLQLASGRGTSIGLVLVMSMSGVWDRVMGWYTTRFIYYFYYFFIPLFLSEVIHEAVHFFVATIYLLYSYYCNSILFLINHGTKN